MLAIKSYSSFDLCFVCIRSVFCVICFEVFCGGSMSNISDTSRGSSRTNRKSGSNSKMRCLRWTSIFQRRNAHQCIPFHSAKTDSRKNRPARRLRAMPLMPKPGNLLAMASVRDGQRRWCRELRARRQRGSLTSGGTPFAWAFSSHRRFWFARLQPVRLLNTISW